jgi:hypothetical protein
MVKRLRGANLKACRSRRGRAKGKSPSQTQPRVAAIKRLVRPLVIEMVPISALRHNARNARRHSDRQVTQIAASILNFGFLVPILADENKTLVAGHGRLLAAEQIGMTEVPVVWIDHLSEAQKRGYALADNRLAELSDWDPELLKLEIEELSALELPFDLEITGFDTVELDRILGSEAPAHDPADATHTCFVSRIVPVVGLPLSNRSHATSNRVSATQRRELKVPTRDAPAKLARRGQKSQ